jgi:hypothetical protein
MGATLPLGEAAGIVAGATAGVYVGETQEVMLSAHSAIVRINALRIGVFSIYAATK